MTAADEYQRVLLAPSTFNIVGLMRHIFGDEVGDALEVLLAQEAEHAASTLAADPGVRAAVEREARVEALRSARDEIAGMLDGFPQHGRYTRAGWAVRWLDHIIDRQEPSDEPPRHASYYSGPSHEGRREDCKVCPPYRQEPSDGE